MNLSHVQGLSYSTLPSLALQPHQGSQRSVLASSTTAHLDVRALCVS